MTEQMLLKRLISGDATDEFGVRASTEFFHQGSFTEFDRSLGEVQLYGDRLVSLPRQDRLQDCSFLWCDTSHANTEVLQKCDGIVVCRARMHRNA